MLEKLLINDVTTGESDAYPWLQPVEYDLPLDVVFEGVVRVARAQPRWRNFQVDADARELKCEAVTRLMRYVDDVWFWVDDGGEHGRARVRARSKSRVGKGDFGANAKRIDDFFRKLHADLGRATA